MQRNDELVHEIPVYQSKALNDQLYVIQYPLMPQKVSLDDWEVREIKVKPGQDRIQVTLDMNTKVRYDENKERSRATEHENDEDERTPLEHQRVMATSGIPLSARSSRYVIGIVQGGKLHLSCIKSIVEMRDIVPHPDIREKDGKDVDADDSKMIPEADSEPTKISVKFNQLRENGPKPKYVRSYSFQRHQHQEYPWINLKHSQQDLLPKLSQNSFESETPFYCLSAKDYLELLFPKVVEVKPGISTNSQAKSSNVQKVPISEMKDLPLEEQLRNIMFSTQVIRYSDLVEVVHQRLGGDIDDDSLLHSLQTVALVVQGCWVVKSDVLYPASFTSNAHGIGAIEMRRGRDVILSHLNQKRIVERPEMCCLTKLPNEEVTEILSGVAVVIPMTGWEFKYPFDSDFVATYPEVVQRHSLMLELKVSSTQRPYLWLTHFLISLLI